MLHRPIVRTCSTLLLLCLCVGLVQAQSQKADLVLKNGTIYTMDFKRPKAEAVAVVGNKITAVGSNGDVESLIGPNTKVLDLNGQTVVPGFIESHGHLMGIGNAQLILNLVGTKSYQEIIDKVAAAVKTRRAGELIVGRGWHEGKWTDTSTLTVRGFQTHHALSAVSPNNPVYLTRADGHAGFANAKTMELAGITKDTKPPEGGEIIKDKDGNPTGIFVDNAQRLIREALNKLPKPTPEQQRVEARKTLELAIQECLEKGITSFDDAGVSLETINLYKEYAQQGKLGMRLYVMISGLDGMRRFGKPQVGLYNNFLTVRSVKFVADGALGSRGAALLEPYLDDPGNSGFFTTPPDTILAAARYALANGFQVCVHAIGDRGNRMMLDMFEKAMKEYPQVKDTRFRDEHTQILDEQDIPRFVKLGVIASMQGIHCTSDRPWAINRLGPARTAEGAYVWQKLLKSGAKIINGTDAPVEDVNPIKSFYASVTREDESGNPAGGFDPDERMSREEALRSYTLDAAYGSFEENMKGAIESGKLADFTVLSKDIMTVPEDDILKAEVLYTIVDGRVRYEKGAMKPAVP